MTSIVFKMMSIQEHFAPQLILQKYVILQTNSSIFIFHDIHTCSYVYIHTYVYVYVYKILTYHLQAVTIVYRNVFSPTINPKFLCLSLTRQICKRIIERQKMAKRWKKKRKRKYSFYCQLTKQKEINLKKSLTIEQLKCQLGKRYDNNYENVQKV